MTKAFDSRAIDRRLLIKAGTFGLAALATPGAALAFTMGRGFTHGVASGEPDHHSVLLWTRYAADHDVDLTAEIAEDEAFERVIARASTVASPARDHIAKIVLGELSPGQWYFYRFVAPDGSFSDTGRTRTLPQGSLDAFNIAVFSCSNLPFGWFNAYAHASARSDIDLVMHLGDYLYEYPAGSYPDTRDIVEGRILAPQNELVTLADYRLRYAAYRSDPDLRRLHQLYPMIAMWDDHEFANDAWSGGAQNHQSDSEGDWEMRKRVAEQAYREWLPVSDRSMAQPRWSAYQIGNLATVIKTESRIGGRDEPAELAAALAGKADLGAAIRTFRDDIWQDPNRQMLGSDQEAWLAEQFRQSRSSGTIWQLWAQQCVMGSLRVPEDSASWVPADSPDYVVRRAQAGAAASRAGLPFNMDAWDGYPVARNRALTMAQQAEANLVVLSGDSHNGWAFDLDANGAAAGVEFAGQSVTSPGLEGYVRTKAADEVAAALVATNPQLRWTDTSHRGYLTVQLTPERATASWHKLRTIRERDTALAGSATQSVAAGRNQLAAD
ncbi:MAG: alkaline phosphatase D family protein [Blastomonas sp.]